MMPNLRELSTFQAPAEDAEAQIVRGLQAPQKTLPAKLFYDEAGSQLFDRICRLPEYYLTRTEQGIMDACVDEMCAEIGESALLVELGSGSSLKTRTLLDRLPDPAGYVPVDISTMHLLESARCIAERYPDLEVMPVFADYDRTFELPVPARTPKKTVVYFPGSTIGNFHPPEVLEFFSRMREIGGDEMEMLVGVDLKKDAGVLHRAYNDSEGVTAAFNLNMLLHLNQIFGSDFDPGGFEHVAFYNASAGRIEMHLRSKREQTVQMGGAKIVFKAGECIWTESSYKYSLEEFQTLAEGGGFSVRKVWTDADRLFSVQYLCP